jgi:hypothetical protein
MTGVVVATASVLGVVGVGATAGAQMVFRATQTIGDDSASVITSRSVERYAKLLGLDDDQKAIATALHEGYSAAATEANREFQDAMTAARRSFEDTGDGTVFGETIPAARKKRSETYERLESQFFDDLALVLTEAQAESLPRLERLRRRETLLPAGALSGETVDLTELVEDLEIDATTRQGLDETIAQYEVELDRALVKRDAIQAKGREAMSMSGGGGNYSFDPGDIEKMRENAEKAREASLDVRAVNERYARIISSALGEDLRPAFETAFHTQSFPQVYHQSSVQDALSAAAGFADLTPDQRRAIQDLAAAHQRDRESVNRRWADAIRESEQDGGSGAMMAFGGGMMIGIGHEDPESPVGEARKARRELDDRTREKLLASLNDGQRERLPKRSEREGDVRVEGGPPAVGVHQMIIEVEEDDGGGR